MQEQLVITDTQMQQRSRSPRRSVFINGEYAFGLSEEIFVKMGLFKGTVVTEDFLARVKQEEDIYQAKQAGLRLCNRRMYGTTEMERKLRTKKFSPEAIESAVRFLKEYNMLDDAEFASAFVADKLLKKRIGRGKLRSELQSKGISKELADQTLRTKISDETELANAIKAAERKTRSLRSDDPKKRERTLAQFLQTRGFDWDTIRKAVAEILHNKQP